MAIKQRISPCLWFDSEAEEAARFYTEIFRNSRITNITRFSKAGVEVHGRPAGSVMVVAFELDGQAFTAQNSRHTERAMDAMLKMKKIDIAELRRAYRGRVIRLRALRDISR